MTRSGFKFITADGGVLVGSRRGDQVGLGVRTYDEDAMGPIVLLNAHELTQLVAALAAILAEEDSPTVTLCSCPRSGCEAHA